MPFLEPTPRVSRHALEWKLMSVSLALLGMAGWNAAREPGPVLKPYPLAAPVAVLPPVGLGLGVAGERGTVVESINSTNSKPASLPQVAFREEK